MTTLLGPTDKTYLFPVAKFRGFISQFLNAPKKYSTGDAEYECGPVNKTGTLRSSKSFIDGLHTWYGALSRKSTTELYQNLFSSSSFFTKELKKILMT